MTIDERLGAAFDNRLRSLEATMTTTKPSPNPARTPPPESPWGAGFFGSIGPWLVGGVVVAVVAIGAVALLQPSPDNTTVIVADSATTTTVVATTSDEPATTATEGGTGTTAVTPPAGCTGGRYSLPVLAGWYHEGCQVFSPAPVQTPGEVEYRPEIDVFFTTSETYAQALVRVQADLNPIGQEASTVDGQAATIFTLEEEWYEVGFRRVYVVDAGDGVFFASANELIDTPAPLTDLDSHYAASVIALDQMMATATITYVAPATPVCLATPEQPATATASAVGDIDGDGTADAVAVMRPDADPQAAYLRATTASGTLYGIVDYADPLSVANDQLHLVDFDGNGASEVLVSTSANTSGANFEARQVAGCALDPIGGVVGPALTQHASVGTYAGFGCLPQPDGSLDVQVVESAYDEPIGAFLNDIETFRLSGGQWNVVSSTQTTTANQQFGTASFDDC